MTKFVACRAEEYDETEDYHRTYDASSHKEAAELAAEYDHSQRDGWEWSWPVIYKVRSPSGQLALVEISREMVPDFHASDFAELPMASMVHVLHVTRAMCSDIRLDAVPGKWPEGQLWIAYDHVVDNGELLSELEKVTCEPCKRRTTSLAAAIKTINTRQTRG